MLYLVSTPIGNLGDFSERARQTLENVDLVACEDTRTSGQLFALLGIKVVAMTPYHEHNADSARPKLIAKLKKGVEVALVSDAGTPLISDPGYKLVRECRAQGIPVTTVPGANAVLSALQLSGLPSNAFFFGGFLPPKTGARQQMLSNYRTIPGTLIFYETANRLCDTLQDILAVLGNREMAVVREITKKFEETRNGTVQSLLDYYSAPEHEPRGEMVLVIGKADDDAEKPSADDMDKLIVQTLKTHSVRDTVDIVVGLTGEKKKTVYRRVLELEE